MEEWNWLDVCLSLRPLRRRLTSRQATNFEIIFALKKAGKPKGLNPVKAISPGPPGVAVSRCPVHFMGWTVTAGALSCLHSVPHPRPVRTVLEHRLPFYGSHREPSEAGSAGRSSGGTRGIRALFFKYPKAPGNPRNKCPDKFQFKQDVVLEL